MFRKKTLNQVPPHNSSFQHHDQGYDLKYEEDSEILNCKLFFGSNQILDKSLLLDHFSKYGTVLDVYLRPETGTSGNVTFYETNVTTNLLKNHQYMDLLDGKFLEIKEWKSRDDLKAKDVVTVRNLRNGMLHKGSTMFEVSPVSVPEAVPSHSKSTFKLRIKNKTSSLKALSHMLKENHSKQIKILTPLQHEVVVNGQKKVIPGLVIGSKDLMYMDIDIEYESSEPGSYRYVLKFKIDNVIVPYCLNMRVIPHRGSSNLSNKRKIVPAFPPDRVTSIRKIHPSEEHFVEALGEYPLPDVIQRDVDKTGHSKVINPWNCRENWKGRMRDLLFIEEAEHLKLIRDYDLKNITMSAVESYRRGETTFYTTPEDPMVRIEIPGLAEKRPSVMPGDSVYAWLPGTEELEYEGYIHMVEQSCVLVLFHPTFHQKVWAPSRTFNVRFGFNRYSWRIMHRATERVELDVVWPDREGSNEDNIEIPQIHINDAVIAQNKRQVAAIHSALKKHWQRHKVPFLLFGPFGTGKTKTLVELIQQILINMKDARILVCTPSNSAADVFAVKLAKSNCTPSQLLRMYAFHRPRHLVPPEIVDYIQYDEENKIFTLPSLQAIRNYRVIVSTCTNSAQLFGIGVGKDHFTHIILDEAAQVMEPEALIPLSLANKQCTIIMAGDPKQLGPRFQNKAVQQHELAKSIMERLSTYAPYSEGENRIYNCVDLVDNYRSHKAILQFPSSQFYKNSLVAKADPDIVNSLRGWDRLKNKNFPLLFCAVEGQDVRDPDSPSFYNLSEVRVIADLISDLVDDQKVNQRDIGVIAPFYKQVQKLREELRQRGLRFVTVAGIDEFQGKEYKALFISTVRSSSKWKDYDTKHGLGLFDAKTLNTSITRAVALLVVVTDPYIAYQYEHWKSLIQYCSKNNSYIGVVPNDEYVETRKQKELNQVENDAMNHDTFGHYIEQESFPILNNTSHVNGHKRESIRSEFDPIAPPDHETNLQSFKDTDQLFSQMTIQPNRSFNLDKNMSMDSSFLYFNDMGVVPSPRMSQDSRFAPNPFVDTSFQQPWNPNELPSSDMHINNNLTSSMPNQSYGYNPGWFSFCSTDCFSIYARQNFSSPPISVVDKGHILEIQVSTYRMNMHLSRNGNKITIELTPEIAQNSLLYVTPLQPSSLLIEFKEDYFQYTEFHHSTSVLYIEVSQVPRMVKFNAQPYNEKTMPLESPNDIQQQSHPGMSPPMFPMSRMSMFGNP